ncbi:hypothetical protein Tco_0710131 [Tanacetum coccineum]
MKLINNEPTQPLENNHFLNNVTPLKKQAKLQGQRSFQATTTNRQKGSCVLLTPSVPNSSRNERRKPVEPLVFQKVYANMDEVKKLSQAIVPFDVFIPLPTTIAISRITGGYGQ